MKRSIVALVSAGSLLFSIAAFAQSTPSAGPAAPATVAPPAQDSSAAAAPVPGAKRAACQSSAQALRGQERRDQMQLCMTQARLDCLKQAIDQKITGPQRKDFVKSCAS